jgi:hypothetical protein
VVRARLLRTCSASLGAAVAALALWALPARAETEATPIVGSHAVSSTVQTFLVRTLPRPVRVRIVPCPGDPSAQGCHSANSRMDTIWLNPGAGGLDTETVAHEMGHVFESYMWDLRWAGVPHSDFVPGTFSRIAAILFDDPGPGILYSVAWSEQFADSYSACARFSELSETLITGYYGFEMTPSQHDRVCPLIDRMARDYEAATAHDPSVLGAVAVRG